MAITNYSELQIAVANWANRSDLTSLIPDFIMLAETRINRMIRLPVQEVTTTLATGAVTKRLTLPSDFLELKGMVLINGDIKVNLQRFPVDEVRASIRSGIPVNYARLGQEYIFDPQPDAQYNIELYYYKQLDPLSDANTTNYWVTSAPDAVLYGALVELAIYIEDEEQQRKWSARFKTAMAEIERHALTAEYAGSPISAR